MFNQVTVYMFNMFLISAGTRLLAVIWLLKCMKMVNSIQHVECLQHNYSLKKTHFSSGHLFIFKFFFVLFFFIYCELWKPDRFTLVSA